MTAKAAPTAEDAALIARVRAVFGERLGVEERRMMGGLSFMVANHMCCSVSRGRLMVRVGREHYPAALEQPHVAPMELGGRRPIGYVLVAPAALHDDAALRRWLMRAIAVVEALPQRPPRAEP